MTANEGFWRLEHDGLAALLARSDLSWETARVYLALADLTLGYSKHKDSVSLSQIAERAGFIIESGEPPRPHPSVRQVTRALSRLAVLGLYGQSKGQGQRVLRWVVWPAPTTDVVVRSDKVVSSATDGTVPGARDKTTDNVVRHQDSKKTKKTKDKKDIPADKPPGVNSWALWLDVWRVERPGQPDPIPTGPDTKAAKVLAKAITDKDELAALFCAYLRDGDGFLVKQGHPLRLLPGRASAYRGGERMVQHGSGFGQGRTGGRVGATFASAERQGDQFHGR